MHVHVGSGRCVSYVLVNAQLPIEFLPSAVRRMSGSMRRNSHVANEIVDPGERSLAAVTLVSCDGCSHR